MNITAFRLPEVAFGEHQYIPYDPSYEDGTFLGTHHHAQYVSDVTFHARGLEAGGYLLKADADAIIQRASDSDIGGP